MTGGGPGSRTELIWTYVDRLAFTGQQFARGTAMSYVTVLVSFAFTYMFFRNVLKSRWEGGRA
jgi:multiple sugar transport system permease protein